MSDSARSQPADLQQWRLRDRAGDVNSSEPIAVFALKSLLYPVIPVLTLLVCRASARSAGRSGSAPSPGVLRW